MSQICPTQQLISDAIDENERVDEILSGSDLNSDDIGSNLGSEEGEEEVSENISDCNVAYIEQGIDESQFLTEEQRIQEAETLALIKQL